MINPQLLDYVRQQLAAGVSKDAVKKALATQRWNEQDVNEVFTTIERPTPTSPPQPVTQTPTTPINQPISVQPKKFSRSLIFLGVIVLILILGAGSAYAFYKFNPSTFAWLNKTLPVENTDTSTGGVYAMYCNDSVSPLPVVKVGVDLKTAKYDEVKAAITTAISQNDTERLGLLYFFLSRYLQEYRNGINFQRPPALSAQGVTPTQLSSLFDLAATSTKPFQKQWLQQVSTLSSTSTQLQNLFSDLASGNVKDIGLVLGIAGYREIMEQNNFDEGLSFIKCAAEHYYDDLAMHNLGQIYRWGEQQKHYVKMQEEWAKLPAKETQSPEAISAYQALEELYPEIFRSPNPLSIDNKQSLFWALAAEVLDPIKHQVFTDSSYPVGWNNIAVIDTIVNTDVLTEPEMQQVECQVGAFLGKRYPDLGDAKASCEFSATSVDTISSYMHTVRNDLLIAQYTVANQTDLKDFSLGSCKKLEGSVFGSDRVINDIKTAAGGDASKGKCIAKGKDFAVSVPLPSAPGNSWCIDSTGGMKQIKGVITGLVCK